MHGGGVVAYGGTQVKGTEGKRKRKKRKRGGWARFSTKLRGRRENRERDYGVGGMRQRYRRKLKGAVVALEEEQPRVKKEKEEK